MDIWRLPNVGALACYAVMVADQSAQVPLTPNVFSFKRPLILPSEPSWIVELAEVLAGRTGAPRAAVIHVDPDGDLDPPRRGPKAVKNPGAT